VTVWAINRVELRGRNDLPGHDTLPLLLPAWYTQGDVIRCSLPEKEAGCNLKGG
jgi:hypothetical protein